MTRFGLERKVDLISKYLWEGSIPDSPRYSEFEEECITMKILAHDGRELARVAVWVEKHYDKAAALAREAHLRANPDPYA